MKKLSKVLSLVMVALILVSSSAYAAVNLDNLDDTKINANATTAMEKIASPIIDFITNAAMVLAAVLIAVLGIKFMMGSAEEKAEYKKSMMPLLIGAILVFGAITIAKIVTGIIQ